MKSFLNKAYYFLAGLIFLPFGVSAQVAPGIPVGNTADNILTWAVTWLNRAMPILVTLAALLFVWNAFQFIRKGDKESRKKMLWGLVGMFVILSFWGIVALAQSTLGIGGGGALPVPCVPTDPFC